MGMSFGAYELNQECVLELPIMNSMKFHWGCIYWKYYGKHIIVTL